MDFIYVWFSIKARIPCSWLNISRDHWTLTTWSSSKNATTQKQYSVEFFLSLCAHYQDIHYYYLIIRIQSNSYNIGETNKQYDDTSMSKEWTFLWQLWIVSQEENVGVYCWVRTLERSKVSLGTQTRLNNLSPGLKTMMKIDMWTKGQGREMEI